jgi:hypothetical protein
MLTNRQKQVGTGWRAASARMCSCARVVRRGAAARGGMHLSSSDAYLPGVELGLLGLRGAQTIKNPRFADQVNQI